MEPKAEIVNEIVRYLEEKGNASSGEIFASVAEDRFSLPTLKRLLNQLREKNFLSVSGNGKSTRYALSPSYAIIHPVDPDLYFQSDPDHRKIRATFNHKLIREALYHTPLFTEEELKQLDSLQEKFRLRLKDLSELDYQRELERLAIDLSWKSSQIEGNTYSLLETEILLKAKETAAGKTKDEAVMLLNHKDAIDFVVANPDYIHPLKLSAIEDIHSLLVKELNIDRNIRKRNVGITGTNYRPIDNEYQIREAMEEMCGLVNLKSNVFEKALLILLLISYIQPFNDGNKRTARIVSNAVLLRNGHCPLSFRTVDALEYKKAMVIFYEQNNISVFKKIFITQFEFAVNNYF